MKGFIKNNKRLLIWLIVLTMMLLTIKGAVALTPPTGGVSYWDFSSVNDLWNGHNAINFGATSNTISYPSFNISGDSSPSSYDYDGLNDNTKVASGITELDDASFASISFWVRVDDTPPGGTQYVIFMGEGGGTGAFSFAYRTDGDIDFNLVTHTFSTFGDIVYTVPDNNWHLLTATYDGSNLVGYADSVILGNHSISGTLKHSDNNIIFGSHVSNVNYFDGALDAIKLFNKTLNTTEVENLYNYGSIGYVPTSLFTVTAKNAWNSSSILSFNVTINGTTYNTTTGSIITSLLSNSSSLWDVLITADNYVARTYEDYNVSSNLEAELYDYNSALIYAFDSVSGVVIEDFNISLQSGVNYYYNVSANNVSFFDFIESGEYIVSFFSENYSVSNYVLTMNEGSYQTLNIYATKNSSENVIFTSYDISSNTVLSGVLITQSAILSGSYVVVESKLTDISGRAQFTYFEDVPYSFTASKLNYVDKSFTLTPLFSTYNIMMSPSSTYNDEVLTDDVVVSVIDYNFVNGTSWIYVSFYSPLGSLEYYNVNVTRDNGTSYLGSGALAVGSYINVSFNGSPVVFGDNVAVTLSYKSTKNSGLFYSYSIYPFSAWDDVSGGITSFKDSVAGYSDLEKIFWLSILVMSLSAIFAIFGFTTGEYFVFACVGAIGGLVVGGVLGLINWVAGGFVIFLFMLFILGRLINDG